eukprot:763776-Hanusia_phi.AAC.5
MAGTLQGWRGVWWRRHFERVQRGEEGGSIRDDQQRIEEEEVRRRKLERARRNLDTTTCFMANSNTEECLKAFHETGVMTFLVNSDASKEVCVWGEPDARRQARTGGANQEREGRGQRHFHTTNIRQKDLNEGKTCGILCRDMTAKNPDDTAPSSASQRKSPKSKSSKAPHIVMNSVEVQILQHERREKQIGDENVTLASNSSDKTAVAKQNTREVLQAQAHTQDLTQAEFQEQAKLRQEKDGQEEAKNSTLRDDFLLSPDEEFCAEGGIVSEEEDLDLSESIALYKLVESKSGYQERSPALKASQSISLQASLLQALVQSIVDNMGHPLSWNSRGSLSLCIAGLLLADRGQRQEIVRTAPEQLSEICLFDSDAAACHAMKEQVGIAADSKEMVAGWLLIRFGVVTEPPLLDSAMKLPKELGSCLVVDALQLLWSQSVASSARMYFLSTSSKTGMNRSIEWAEGFLQVK